MRWLASLVCLALLGCTFSDGQPWGQVQASLRVELADTEDRLTPQGDLRTSKDYAVRIQSMQVEYDALIVELQGESAANFDPTDPPAGCSLCHNGHCHCGAALVPYEELAQQAGGGGAQLAIGAGAARVPTNRPATVPLADCGDCLLPRGTLNAATVTLTRLTATVVVRDLREELRIGPTEFPIDIPLSITSVAPLTGALDRESPTTLRLRAVHHISARLFDAVDWATEVPEPALRAQLPEATTLTVTTTRPP